MWRGVGLSDTGRVRQSNQDAFAVVNEAAIWIIADGMGGRPGGDVASHLAVQSMTDVLSSPQEGIQEQRDRLRTAIRAANDVIQMKARRHPELIGMGTTVVALTVFAEPEPIAVVAHVGDSRAYCYRHGELTQLTRDHSFQEKAVAEGLLTRAEAAAHPLRHVLTRAVGTEPFVEPDIVTHPLEPDDLLMLCTDGLTKMLDDEVIRHIMATSGPSPAAFCRRLIDEANRCGGEDNISVIVVRNDLTKPSQDVSFPSASA